MSDWIVYPFVTVLDSDALYSKHDLKMVMMLLYNHDSSSDSSSNEKDDLELMLDLMEKPKRILGPRINLDDLLSLECDNCSGQCLLYLYISSDIYILVLRTLITFNRFFKDDMSCLAIALSLPDKYICKQGTTATGMEALMVMLRRLTYPNRLCDLVWSHKV